MISTVIFLSLHCNISVVGNSSSSREPSSISSTFLKMKVGEVLQRNKCMVVLFGDSRDAEAPFNVLIGLEEVELSILIKPCKSSQHTIQQKRWMFVLSTLFKTALQSSFFGTARGMRKSHAENTSWTSFDKWLQMTAQQTSYLREQEKSETHQ